MIQNRREYDAAAIRLAFLEEKEATCGLSIPEEAEQMDLYRDMDTFELTAQPGTFKDLKDGPRW